MDNINNASILVEIYILCIKVIQAYSSRQLLVEQIRAGQVHWTGADGTVMSGLMQA